MCHAGSNEGWGHKGPLVTDYKLAATVECPKGSFITGGGFSLTGGRADVNRSVPLANNSWEVNVINYVGGIDYAGRTYSVVPFAVCMYFFVPKPGPTPTWTATPTPFPTTVPPVVKFTVPPPTSFDQLCPGSPAPLPPLTITLDSTQSTVAVSWHIDISEQDPSKSELWAAASPTGGSLPSQQTTKVTITPAPDLCARFGSTTTPIAFHATVTWTTGGGGTATITDMVYPYVIG